MNNSRKSRKKPKKVGVSSAQCQLMKKTGKQLAMQRLKKGKRPDRLPIDIVQFRYREKYGDAWWWYKQQDDDAKTEMEDILRSWGEL